MRYLSKTPDSEVLKNEWVYSNNANRNRQIKQVLTKEQLHFCAYSERCLLPLDAYDVEHFDDRKKGTQDDDYWNYYAVLHSINSKKKAIEQFLPMLSPHSPELTNRITFRNWEFRAVDDEDREAINLINFLNVNGPEIYKERMDHVERLRFLKENLGDEKFIKMILRQNSFLSFWTAVETMLELKALCIWNSVVQRPKRKGVKLRIFEQT